MRWRERLKLAEFALGMGTAVFIGWVMLSLVLASGLLWLRLPPSGWTRLLGALVFDLGLILPMLLAGALGGLMLAAGCWTFASCTALVAVGFRLAVFLVASEPNPPWPGWPEAVGHLGALLISIVLAAWTFRWSARFGRRRDGKKTPEQGDAHEAQAPAPPASNDTGPGTGTLPNSP